jgi:ribonucleoside-diphosphate reductase alpha chain
MLNRSLPRSLRALGYTEGQVAALQSYCLGTASLRGAPGVSWEALRAKGLPESRLQELESAIPRAWDIESLFSAAFLDEASAFALGIAADRWRDPGFSLLRHLGFSSQQIEAADRQVFGERGIEGAPDLRPEHYAVFDCAQPCGRSGRRSLDYRAHLAIMAAAQPFLSGGISKTINLPGGASPETVQQAFLEAWRRGIKAVSVYRDGSKLSQPLQAEVSPQPPPEAPLCVECG